MALPCPPQLHLSWCNLVSDPDPEQGSQLCFKTLESGLSFPSAGAPTNQVYVLEEQVRSQLHLASILPQFISWFFTQTGFWIASGLKARFLVTPMGTILVSALVLDFSLCQSLCPPASPCYVHTSASSSLSSIQFSIINISLSLWIHLTSWWIHCIVFLSHMWINREVHLITEDHTTGKMIHKYISFYLLSNLCTSSCQNLSIAEQHSSWCSPYTISSSTHFTAKISPCHTF